MANKGERVWSIIAKNVTEIIMFKVKNPNLGFITITGVDVSNDFSYAKVYVSFMGKKGGTPEKRLEELNKSKSFIRHELAKTLDIHKTPELSFHIDDSFERSQKLEESLKREKEELESIKKKW